MKYDIQSIKNMAHSINDFRFTPATITVIGIVVALSFGVTVAHKYRFNVNPEFEQDVKDYRQDCLEKGGKYQECDNMAILMRKAHDENPRNATSACEAAEFTVYTSCVDRVGDDRLGDGEKYYLAREKVKDMPMCDKLALDAYSGCNFYGK